MTFSDKPYYDVQYFLFANNLSRLYSCCWCTECFCSEILSVALVYPPEHLQFIKHSSSSVFNCPQLCSLAVDSEKRLQLELRT